MRRRKKLALCLASILFALILVEVGLWLAGYEPGFLDAGSPNGTPYVPGLTLQVERVFVTDHEGVFKANPEYFPPGMCPEGFRSPPLRYEPTREPRVLFLGDSFTWGHSAWPIDRCFVDLVRDRGYYCYNTGIPGTGLAQYAFLAEKYVPELRPNYVAVMIYMGNDLKSALRNPMKPDQDLYYQTNMGWLYAFDLEGRHMSPAEAYRFAHDLAFQYMKNLNGFTKRLFLTTRVGTLAGVGLSKLRHWLEGAGYPGGDAAYVRDSLRRIREVCDRHHAKMLVFLIPCHPDLVDASTSIAGRRHLFDGYAVHTPDDIGKEDYQQLPEDHLNNAGHRLFAHLILKVLAGE